MTPKMRALTHIPQTIRIACLTAAFVVAAALGADAQSENADDGARLVGAWMVQVTLRDCTSGAPLGPVVNSLVTFHADRTISESPTTAGFAPDQRSAGHGAWSPQQGHTFRHDMVALIAFTTDPNLPGTPAFDPTKPVSPGFFAGWQTVNHTIRFTGDGQIASTGTNTFYRTTGEVYRTGCSTATGRRFE